MLLNQRGFEETLQKAVQDHHGRNVSIERVESRPSGYSSSYDARIITLHLSSNRKWQIFFKDLSYSRFPKDDGDMRRHREIHVYRDLLSSTELGTPALYDAVWDESDARFWLLMEYLPGRPLSEFPQEFWVQAFGWLGRLHGHFATQVDRLMETSYLVRHEPTFYLDRLERSHREVATASPELLAEWRDVGRRIKPLLEEIAALPLTLVHGDYNPRNIIVHIDGERSSRIGPVDWERAAIGSAYFDMAMLADGFELPVIKLMFDAYRREAATYGMLMPDDTTMLNLAYSFQLFRIVTWLSRAHERRFSRKKIGHLISLADASLRAFGPIDNVYAREA